MSLSFRSLSFRSLTFRSLSLEVSFSWKLYINFQDQINSEMRRLWPSVLPKYLVFPRITTRHLKSLHLGSIFVWNHQHKVLTSLASSGLVWFLISV